MRKIRMVCMGCNQTVDLPSRSADELDGYGKAGVSPGELCEK